MERQNCELHLLPLLNIGATTTSTSSGPGFLFGRLFHYWQFKFSSSDIFIWLPSPGCFQMTLNLIELWLVIYLTLSLESYCTPCYQNCLLYFLKKKKKLCPLFSIPMTRKYANHSLFLFVCDSSLNLAIATTTFPTTTMFFFPCLFSTSLWCGSVPMIENCNCHVSNFLYV